MLSLLFSRLFPCGKVIVYIYIRTFHHTKKQQEEATYTKKQQEEAIYTKKREEVVIVAEIEINNNNNNEMDANIENANEDTKRENDNEINLETTSSKQVRLPNSAPIDWPKISETTPHRI
uniref:Uncharacterized protein n=1 Tax=Glossina austeni TaxID=7395 RepID=A0A1A9VGR6_GLOAU